MSDQPIRVNFPRTMDVRSPEIDAVARSTKTIADILHRDIKAIVDPLQVLKQLPGIIENLEQRVAEQFQEMFTHQIEADVVTRKANILALNHKVKMIQEHIEKKIQQLGDARERIQERYEKIAKQLEKQHTSMLQRLDSHVYHITDSLYPEMVQKKFSFSAIPAQEMLAAHSQESTVMRSVCLYEGFLEAKKEIENFLLEREEFYARLEDLTTDILTPGNYEIPFWYAEVEEIDTGKKKMEIFFEWELQGKADSLNDNEKLKLYEAAETQAVSDKQKTAGADFSSLLRDMLAQEEGMDQARVSQAMKDCTEIMIKDRGEHS